MNIRKKELVGVFFGLGALCALDCSGMQLPQSAATAGNTVVALRRSVDVLLRAMPVVRMPNAATVFGGNHQEANDARGILARLHGSYIALRQNQAVPGSQNNGAQNVLHADNAQHDIGLYTAMAGLTNGITNANGQYAQNAIQNNAERNPQLGQDGVDGQHLFGAYIAFAAAAGNIHAAGVDAAHVGFAALANQGDAADTRNVDQMIAGMTPANLRAYGVTLNGTGLDADNGRLALYFGLLALSEIAEFGTIGGTNLGGGVNPVGYTDPIMAGINAIVVDLHN